MENIQTHCQNNNDSTEKEKKSLNLCFSFTAATKFQLSLTPPDFAQYKVNDLFRSLGPIAIFSAKRHWTAPRLIQLNRNKNSEGFGFSIRGDAPVIVAAVEQKSIAEVSSKIVIKYLKYFMEI